MPSSMDALNIFLPEVFTSDAVLVQFVFEQRSESESITRW